MDFICFKIPYEYRPCLDLKQKKITPRTRPQIRLYGVKNTACNEERVFDFFSMTLIQALFGHSKNTLGDKNQKSEKKLKIKLETQIHI